MASAGAADRGVRCGRDRMARGQTASDTLSTIERRSGGWNRATAGTIRGEFRAPCFGRARTRADRRLTRSAYAPQNQ